jgi:hypothetical protein
MMFDYYLNVILKKYQAINNYDLVPMLYKYNILNLTFSQSNQ